MACGRGRPPNPVIASCRTPTPGHITRAVRRSTEQPELIHNPLPRQPLPHSCSHTLDGFKLLQEQLPWWVKGRGWGIIHESK
ncbi:hypothetical protein J6590_039219 [Homalodisca vitripennis]|nr:hypothetical protein J6590_039219 [Homalodisca vitripennis]